MKAEIPYRLSLAGGWIDQPFVSRLDPSPPGSMVVVALEPTVRFMERSGMATSTRKAVLRLWGGRMPDGDPAALVRELYTEENRDRPDPSGSQDMAGLIYPGISRLDYDAAFEGGVFPVHVESTDDSDTIAWLESVLQMLPVGPRPSGYDPLGLKNLDPAWIRRLGASGADCYAAILDRNLPRLGAALNECMLCWEFLLPNTIRHPSRGLDRMDLWRSSQDRHPGAMFSGCGGGYLIVASGEEIAGAFRIRVRRRLSGPEGKRS
jgi:hypothetical protein